VSVSVWRVRSGFYPDSVEVRGWDAAHAAEEFVEDMLDAGKLGRDMDAVLVVVESPSTFEAVQMRVTIEWEASVFARVVNPEPGSEPAFTSPPKFTGEF